MNAMAAVSPAGATTAQMSPAMMMVWPALCVRWAPNACAYWFDFDARRQEEHRTLAMTHAARALPEIARLRQAQAAPSWLLDVHHVGALIKQGRFQDAERRIDELARSAACKEALRTYPAHAPSDGLAAAQPLWLLAFGAVEQGSGTALVLRLWAMGLRGRAVLEPHLASSLLLLAIAEGAAETAQFLSGQGVTLTPADHDRLTTNLAHIEASGALVADEAVREARSHKLAGMVAAMATLENSPQPATALMSTRARGFRQRCVDLFYRVRGAGSEAAPRSMPRPTLERAVPLKQPRTRRTFFRGRGV